MTGKPETPLPAAGGSYIRDPQTGALQAVPAEAEAPARTSEKPAPKPVKQPAKEA